MRKFNYYKVKRLLHRQSGNQNTFVVTPSSVDQDSSDEESSDEQNSLVKTFLNFISKDDKQNQIDQSA